MSNNDPQIEVIVEYDQFIAGRELSEIIEVLDEALWYEIEEAILPMPLRYHFPRILDQRPPSTFCIAEVKEGSLILVGAVGGAAVAYCYNRFKRGFRRSRFGDEIEHLGRSLGENLGRVLERMSHWLDEYTADAKDNHSRIRSIKVRRKTDEKESNR